MINKKIVLALAAVLVTSSLSAMCGMGGMSSSKSKGSSMGGMKCGAGMKMDMKKKEPAKKSSMKCGASMDMGSKNKNMDNSQDVRVENGGYNSHEH